MANLLIVEDDVLTNESVCEYLQDMGHIVFSAYDGEQALELFNSKEIDLVVLDIMLPQINGLNVLKKIRQASSIPILMLTAMDDMDTQIMSFDNLADGCPPIWWTGFCATPTAPPAVRSTSCSTTPRTPPGPS